MAFRPSNRSFTFSAQDGNIDVTRLAPPSIDKQGKVSKMKKDTTRDFSSIARSRSRERTTSRRITEDGPLAVKEVAGSVPLRAVSSLSRGDPSKKYRRPKHEHRKCGSVSLRDVVSAKARSSNLWDRCVFALFCVACIWFFHALAGLGPIDDDAGHDSHLVRSGSYYSYTKGKHVADGSRRNAKLKIDWEGDYNMAFDHHLVSEHVQVPSAAPEYELELPTPKATPTDDGALAVSTLSNSYRPMAMPEAPAFYDPRYNPFEMDSPFDSGNYDNEGRPWALKIHLKSTPSTMPFRP